MYDSVYMYALFCLSVWIILCVCVGKLYQVCVCVCLNVCTILLGTGGEEGNDTSSTEGTEDVVVCRRHGLEH